MPPATELIDRLAGRQPRCTLLVGPTCEHAEQLATGLQILASAGVVRLDELPSTALDWECGAPRLSHNRSLVRMLVNGIPVAYDLDDSTAISKPAVVWADHYFKRMLHPADASTQIRPYGLNYPVVLAESRVAAVGWRDAPSHHAFKPLRARGAGVLYLTRLWDPSEARSDVDRMWREELNSFRIDVLLALRAQLGDELVGGIAEDRHSTLACPPELLAPGVLTAKDSYLSLTRSAAVVVTTLGLHQSIGWRFGEALALGRAVATEHFQCLVPGSFSEGVHYLGFGTPCEASEGIKDLLESPDRLDDLQARAWTYYEQWLRPDVLVARSIGHVLGLER